MLRRTVSESLSLGEGNGKEMIIGQEVKKEQIEGGGGVFELG